MFFILPVSIKPKYILYGILAIEAYGFIFMELKTGSSIAHSAHLGGIITGYSFYIFQPENRTLGFLLSKIPKFTFNGPKSKTVRNPIKFGTKAKGNYTVNLNSDNSLQEEIDKILDKINSDGFGALNQGERNLLEKQRISLRSEPYKIHSYKMILLIKAVIILISHQLLFANFNQENSSRILEKENDTPQVGLKTLVPNEQMSQETKWLLRALEKAHFNKISALDVNASEFLEKFLNNLDRQKLFFSQKDLRKYNDRYCSTLVTYLSQGNLFPAFEIYSDYREKAIARLNGLTDNALSNLSLESNQTFTPIRQDIQWERDEEELNNSWQKSVMS